MKLPGGFLAMSLGMLAFALVSASDAAPRAKATAKKTKPAAETSAPKAPETPTPAAKTDSSYTLRGGQEGTAFKSLTVEGEDRIQFEFDRPALRVNVDPTAAPGLDWGTARDVLDRTAPDLVTPFVAMSAHQPSPYVGRPWLNRFSSGAVARFRPQVKDVVRWKLVVANAKGQVVTTFEGKGEPPQEIAWDGRAQNGAPVVPGLTYSYVFEAFDRAGNKRNFVGEGFQVAAYRLESTDGPMLIFSGQDLATNEGGGWNPTSMSTSTSTPPLILEAASWLNQAPRTKQPIRVRAAARSFEQATHLAEGVTRALAPLVIGDAARVQANAVVEPDAPVDGALTIAFGK